ncbi:unnamed protein product [Brassica rapa subsp. narinosa]
MRRSLCLAAAIDAAEDPVRLRHVLLPRLERSDELEDQQPKDLYERFVNALDELSDDTLPDLKEKALKVETKELGETLDVASKLCLKWCSPFAPWREAHSSNGSVATYHLGEGGFHKVRAMGALSRGEQVEGERHGEINVNRI